MKNTPSATNDTSSDVSKDVESNNNEMLTIDSERFKAMLKEHSETNNENLRKEINNRLDKLSTQAQLTYANDDKIDKKKVLNYIIESIHAGFTTDKSGTQKLSSVIDEQKVKAFMQKKLDKDRFYEAEKAKNIIDVSSFSDGGAAIDDEFLQQLFVPVLYERTAVLNSGLTLFPTASLSGSIPKELLQAITGWRNAQGASTQSQYGTGRLNWELRNLNAIQLVTNESLMVDSAFFANRVSDNLMTKAGVDFEDAFFYGGGTVNEPLGINGQMTSSNQVASAGGVTLDTKDTDAKKAFNLIENNNLALPNTSWFMNTAVKNALWFTRDGNGNEIFGNIDASRVYRGRPVGLTNVITNDYSANDTKGGIKTHLWLVDLTNVIGFQQANGMSLEFFPNSAYVDSNGDVQSGVDRNMSQWRLNWYVDILMLRDTAAAKIYDIEYNV